ncbi:MAG: hypothetical protein LC135_05650 [Phycisphaerae bacterium]|nr:hypothetical protein [Phycisphaerae bacterium]MCZ2399340.1 hypothetical protein [Phycisphaerae bacterium]NUQ48413.1 hypothetical protein [Phycisphaerae bacterium]
MREGVCKPAPHARRPRFRAAARCALVGVGALTLASCAAPAWRTVRSEDLDAAPEAAASQVWHVRLSDPARIVSQSKPLSRRMALIQLRTRADWQALAEAAPQLGPCPDLGRGLVVGVMFFGGTPLGGDWPLELCAVRVFNGAGLVEAHFTGGSFLADGAGYLHLVQVEGLRAVLIVDVDGTRFYPR